MSQTISIADHIVLSQKIRMQTAEAFATALKKAVADAKQRNGVASEYDIAAAWKQTLTELGYEMSYRPRDDRGIELEVRDPAVDGLSVIIEKASDVLSDRKHAYEHWNFDSLREGKWWPRKFAGIDTNGLGKSSSGKPDGFVIFAYASAYDPVTGTMGDWQFTGYIGTDDGLHKHLAKVSTVTERVAQMAIEMSRAGRTLGDLYAAADEFFQRMGFLNGTVPHGSGTGKKETNIGHSFPRVVVSALTDTVKTLMTNRTFIKPKNTGEPDPSIEPGDVLTVEPMLVALAEDPAGAHCRYEGFRAGFHRSVSILHGLATTGKLADVPSIPDDIAPATEACEDVTLDLLSLSRGQLATGTEPAARRAGSPATSPTL